MRLPANWENFLAKAIDFSDFYPKLDKLVGQTDPVIPSAENIFHVFRWVPPDRVRCVLFGEDPYPRLSSANGIAFWDAEIDTWHTKTNGNALKNILKALLVAEGRATYHTSIAECRQIATKIRMKQPPKLFRFWLEQGVLLINTALTYGGSDHKKAHFAFWQPFHQALIRALNQRESAPYYVLWGRKAWRWEKEIQIDLDNTQKVIKQGHPTFIHQFLRKTQPDYSPFKEIQEKTGIVWF